MKIVSEDPDEGDDDDSEEADELEEPDEDKHASSGQGESTPHRGASRKDLNLPSGVRSGNIPVVPGELNDEGKPIRPIATDLQVLKRIAPNFKEAIASKCDHINFAVCPGCGITLRKIEQPPPKPKPNAVIPTVTAEQLTEQFTKPEEKNSPVKSPLITAAQLSAAWNVKPKGRVIPKSERKITREALGIGPIQILEWLDRIVDVDIVTEWDMRPVLKPAPADSCRSWKKNWRRRRFDLEIRMQQHKDLTAAGQKRAAAMGQAPYDSKRRKEFMQVAYRAEIAAAERVRELQARLREMKKASEDWGRDINHWTAERIPGTKRKVTVTHYLRDCWRRHAAKYRDFVELRDVWEEDSARWIPIHPPGHCFPHTTLKQEYFYTGLIMPRVSFEREVIVCAYLLCWYEPPLEIVRKFPRLHDLKNKRLGTLGWPGDPDTEAEDIGAEETQSILKDGGVGAGLTVHGKTWKKLKSFETFGRMTYGSKDGDGDGFYGDMDSGDYGSEDE